MDCFFYDIISEEVITIRIVKILFISTIIFVCSLCLFTVDAVIENVKSDSKITEFIKKGQYEKTINNIHYYTVDIDRELSSPSIEIIRNRPVSTTKGDIYVSQESLLDVLPFVAEFITFYFGGHAGLILDQDYVIETTGMESDPEDNVVIKGGNSVLYPFFDRSTVGLRVDTSQENIDKAMDYALDKVGSKYNYSFIFNRKNTFYCTDLVARAYSSEAGVNGINLDKDGIAVSCNDIITSNDVFITYFNYYIGNEQHIYYAI